MNYWIVNSSKVMIASGDDSFKERCSIGADQVWIAQPEGVALGNCKVAGEWPELSLIDGAADKAGPEWEKVRAERDAKMTKCDWTQLPDTLANGRLNALQVAAWAAYRQNLAAVPQNNVDPAAISWPTQP